MAYCKIIAIEILTTYVLVIPVVKFLCKAILGNSPTLDQTTGVQDNSSPDDYPVEEYIITHLKGYGIPKSSCHAAGIKMIIDPTLVPILSKYISKISLTEHTIVTITSGASMDFNCLRFVS